VSEESEKGSRRGTVTGKKGYNLRGFPLKGRHSQVVDFHVSRVYKRAGNFLSNQISEIRSRQSTMSTWTARDEIKDARSPRSLNGLGFNWQKIHNWPRISMKLDDRRDSHN